jgi:hypothetical protein
LVACEWIELPHDFQLGRNAAQIGLSTALGLSLGHRFRPVGSHK